MKCFLAPVLCIALAASASAQTAAEGEGTAIVEVPATPVDPAVKAARDLDRLFGELQSETLSDPERVEGKIVAGWLRNPSPTAELLLKQASLALSDGALDTSENMLNQLIGTYPEFIEALNRRAALYLKLKRYDEAMADIDLVLEAEPRHFGALAGRGTILAAQGKYEEAEAAFKEALAINPHMDIVKVALNKLQRETPGI
jgi:tetratricopeptide (TPR) repeat protein